MQSKIILMMSVGFLLALISWISLGLIDAIALFACVEHRGSVSDTSRRPRDARISLV